MGIDDDCRTGHVSSPNSDPDETALLERLHEGDEAAYNTIYLTYVAGLIRFARSYVGSASAAEDVVADTFVHLWERRADLSPHFGIKAYLFAAVHNRARKALRSDQRYNRMISRVSSDSAGEVYDLAGVETSIDTATLSMALRHAIESLPADRRRLVSLRWYEGLTVTQIAHVLGVSVGAVEQRLLRTIDTLRKLLNVKL